MSLSDRLAYLTKCKNFPTFANNKRSSLNLLLSPIARGATVVHPSWRTQPEVHTTDKWTSVDKTVNSHSTRQVDALQSCIEAKCSSWNPQETLDCVYQRCIVSFQLGKRNIRRQTGANRELFGGNWKTPPHRQHTTKADRVSSAVTKISQRETSPTSKRGYNDAHDSCAQSNCGSASQQMSYFSCVENHCVF